MKKLALVTTMVFGIAIAADASVLLVVPGDSDPWLAGMPAGSTASGGGDVAPAQSPVEVLGLIWGPGSEFIFSATGLVDHCDGGACGLNGPEGEAGSTGHAAGAENGIGNLIAPVDSLVGVFLDATQPSLSAAPGAVLNFSTLLSRDFDTLSPLLKQPFFIGNGLKNDGTTVQGFTAPAGATRLFLGTMDGFGWFNNVGEFAVTVDTRSTTAVPEPATLALLGAGLSFVAGRRVRRRPN